MMNWINKNWKLISIVLAVICVILGVIAILRPSTEKEVQRLMEAYRKEQVVIYDKAQKRIQSLEADSIATRVQMKKEREEDASKDRLDSIRYTKLKKEHDKIIYRNYSATELDGIRKRILSGDH